MTSITFPTDTKNIIDAIRNAIGRDVLFYTRSGTDCPACTIDPITNTSTNPFCTTCSGIGYIYTETPTTISAHISWAQSEVLGWVQGGQYHEGDCRIQIEYTDANNNLVNDCTYVVIDERRFTVRKRILRGVPEINRILLDCMEEEE